MSKRSSRDAIIALFSGAGGMSLGFAKAGAAPKLAAEIDTDACSTYRNNLSADVCNVDLSAPNRAFDLSLSNISRPLALIGGPPCQGFSSAGIKDSNDPRNRLIFRYLAIVERLRPRWFLFENVEGLLTSSGGESVVDLVGQFIRLGYMVRLEKINFAAYGLPQARKRVVIIGNCIGLDFQLPSATHSFNAGKHKSGRGLPLAPSLIDAISGLGPVAFKKGVRVKYGMSVPATPYDALMRVGNTPASVSLHYASSRTEDVEMFRRLKPGQTMKDLPQEFWHESYKRRANRRVMDGTPTEKRGGAPSGVKRLVSELNSLTITSAATREFVHPLEHRNLTLREAARLQSFPDNFEFAGNAASVARQIGNAFPPLAATRLASHLLELDGRFGGRPTCRSNIRPGGLIGYSLTESAGMSPALQKTRMMLGALSVDAPQLEFEMGKVA